MSATFIVTVTNLKRVLLDGGGEKLVDGLKRKVPARWADFSREGKVTITNVKDIVTLKKHPEFGKAFVLVPEVGAKKEAEKKEEVKEEKKK